MPRRRRAGLPCSTRSARRIRKSVLAARRTVPAGWSSTPAAPAACTCGRGARAWRSRRTITASSAPRANPAPRCSSPPMARRASSAGSASSSRHRRRCPSAMAAWPATTPCRRRPRHRSPPSSRHWRAGCRSAAWPGWTSWPTAGTCGCSSSTRARPPASPSIPPRTSSPCTSTPAPAACPPRRCRTPGDPAARRCCTPRYRFPCRRITAGHPTAPTCPRAPPTSRPASRYAACVPRPIRRTCCSRNSSAA